MNRSEKTHASYVAIASVGQNPRPQLGATSPENERTRYARTSTQQVGRERYQISTHIKIAASSAYQRNSCSTTTKIGMPRDGGLPPSSYMMIDPCTGFAPDRWQSYVGPVIVWCPDSAVSSDDMCAFNDFLSDLLEGAVVCQLMPTWVGKKVDLPGGLADAVGFDGSRERESVRYMMPALAPLRDLQSPRSPSLSEGHGVSS